MIVWLLLPILAVLLLMVVVSWLEPLSDDPLLREWPAIDDDEFLRRCPAGTSRETALTVRRIVADQLDVPYDRVDPRQHFIDDLKA